MILLYTTTIIFICFFFFNQLVDTAAMNYTGNIVFDTTKSDGQYKKTANNK